MASLSSAKSLGGIGSILAIFPVLDIVGGVLILVALKEISDVSHDESIFNDALIATITAIVGAASLVTIPFIFALGFFTLGFFGLLGIIEIFLIVSSLFLKRAYDKVSQQLKIGSFATAGLLYLIGAATAIVLVGFLILFIALIFQIVAYFSIQDQPPQTLYPGYQAPQPMYPPSPPPQQTVPSLIQPVQPQSAPQPQAAIPLQAAPQSQAASEFKFCFRCGTKLPYNAVYCTSCGTKQ